MSTKQPKYEVFCRTQFVGFHQWAQAPNRFAYLAHVHRHVFHVEACVVVEDTERYVEFNDLKSKIDHEIRFLFTNDMLKPLTYSCEEMADMIGHYLLSQNYVPIYVEVSEDGENGGRVRYE